MRFNVRSFLCTVVGVLISVGLLYKTLTVSSRREAVASQSDTLSAVEGETQTFFSISHAVRKNETLASIFALHGITSEHAMRCSEALLLGGLRALFPGDSMVMQIDHCRSLKKMSLLSRLACWYHVSFDSSGIGLQRMSVPEDRYICLARGRLESSLAEALLDLGEDGSLAANLADIFAWDINFFLDPRKGDVFEVLYSKRYAGGKFLGNGEILAARYVNAGREYLAFAYDTEGGRVQYYDRHGKSMQKFFLKAPLNYAKVSSRFSFRRRHPILGIVRPHLGIDYAAPKGTPVYAAAEGTVSFAGWEKGFGYIVRIRHAGAYETSYGHLHRICGHIRHGVKVKQGEQIGTVGATGLATGPHLDYRMKRNGCFVNPLAVSSPAHQSVSPAERASFEARVQEYLSVLRGRMPNSDGCFVVEINRLGCDSVQVLIEGNRHGNARGS